MSSAGDSGVRVLRGMVSSLALPSLVVSSLALPSLVQALAQHGVMHWQDPSLSEQAQRHETQQLAA